MRPGGRSLLSTGLSATPAGLQDLMPGAARASVAPVVARFAGSPFTASEELPHDEQVSPNNSKGEHDDCGFGESGNIHG